MLNNFLKTLLIIFISAALAACATLKMESEMLQGKRYFEMGYYKRAMHELLPLAADGNAQAQYAVGYMYYYGYGVAQDTDAGYFWIKRSADHHYKPAIEALKLINTNEGSKF